MPASPRALKEAGFSLPEVLISMVLLIVVIAALSGFYRSLAMGFQAQWQYRQLWRFASQQAEIAPSTLPAGWNVTRVQTSTAGCVSISVIVTSPTGRHGQLARLHCPSGE